ncbi:hypothetical protein B296_00007365 [Ensete ventricosum]|uniref:Uncharacterized protein n=1 Tax=Ensete ventricosum TaxID=4639 RepID=A0A427B975_ENSVE|nr:hypothetical protein B296_00007365 [Ensete ventricosum]
MDSLYSTRVFTAPVATATTGTKWSRIAVPWSRLLFSTSRALPPRRCWLLGMGSAPHHDRLGHLGPRGISRLNAIVLGEALAAEENDFVFPSHDFSRHAHISSPEQVALYWEGNEPGQDAQQLTYAQMLEKVCQVVFAGFSAKSLSQRIVDCKPKVVISCNAVCRGANVIHLKEIVDTALVESVNSGVPVGM